MNIDSVIRYELFALDALDTWFFREPRPFHAVAGAMASLFPPPCRTMVGALRAALARAGGWSGRGSWSGDVIAALGDGEDLGPLRFLGPILIRGETAFYPLPRHLVGRSRESTWQSAAILAPGEPVSCDLGSVRLPAPVGWRDDDLVQSGPPDGWWGTAEALEAVLVGQPPEARAEVVAFTELVVVEPRVGIQRDRDSRTAADNALYAADHFRPRDGVSVVAGVAGLPEGWPRPTAGDVLAMGGEGRAASLRLAAEPAFPSPPARIVPEARRYSVTFLTPAFLPAEAWRPGAEIPGLPGRVVSACCGEPIRLGGWDTVARRAVEARSAVAAGSTWFLELDENEEPEDLLALHGQHFDPLGDGPWGYGRMAVGAWSAGGTQGAL